MSKIPPLNFNLTGGTALSGAPVDNVFNSGSFFGEKQTDSTQKIFNLGVLGLGVAGLFIFYKAVK